MIANDKCKTFEDTEVDVIYQRFCCLCESETYEIERERTSILLSYKFVSLNYNFCLHYGLCIIIFSWVEYFITTYLR